MVSAGDTKTRSYIITWGVRKKYAVVDIRQERWHKPNKIIFLVDTGRGIVPLICRLPPGDDPKRWLLVGEAVRNSRGGLNSFMNAACMTALMEMYEGGQLSPEDLAWSRMGKLMFGDADGDKKLQRAQQTLDDALDRYELPDPRTGKKKRRTAAARRKATYSNENVTLVADL